MLFTNGNGGQVFVDEFDDLGVVAECFTRKQELRLRLRLGSQMKWIMPYHLNTFYIKAYVCL